MTLRYLSFYIMQMTWCNKHFWTPQEISFLAIPVHGEYPHCKHLGLSERAGLSLICFPQGGPEVLRSWCPRQQLSDNDRELESQYPSSLTLRPVLSLPGRINSSCLQQSLDYYLTVLLSPFFVLSITASCIISQINSFHSNLCHRLSSGEPSLRHLPFPALLRSQLCL